MKKRVLSLLSLFLAMAMAIGLMPVMPASAAGIRLNVTQQTLVPRESFTLRLNGASGNISWSSSDRAVAAVDNNGRVTAVAVGTAAITARNGGKNYTAEIRVVQNRLAVSKSTIAVGEYVNARVAGAVNRAVVTWTSSDASVATVDGGRIYGIKPGRTQITARFGDRRITANVTVRAFKDITAHKLVADIRVGFNLGNTFGENLDTHHIIPPRNSKAPISQLEVWLGNPITTLRHFEMYKEAGFNAVRLNVDWRDVRDSKGKIRADYMARVREIVDYATACDMYVFLNTQFDEMVIFKLRNRDLEQSKRNITSIWGQIAEEFKHYDERLVFQPFNEPGVNEWENPQNADLKH